MARRRVRDGFIAFAETGRGELKKLKGQGAEIDLYRYRTVEYRIVFATAEGEIRVTRIIARSKGNDWL